VVGNICFIPFFQISDLRRDSAPCWAVMEEVVMLELMSSLSVAIGEDLLEDLLLVSFSSF
jgi:hypothetical protein